MKNLAADVYQESDGYWSVVISDHSGPNYIVLFYRRGINNEHNALTCMEAAWNTLNKEPS